MMEFFGGFLAYRMKDQYKITKDHMGYIFATITLPYFVMCFLLPSIN